MAKQKGVIKLQGSLGGMTFYTRNGQDLVRENVGVDKMRIKSDPNYQRTRENNQEFGVSSTIGKAIRLGLIVAYNNMCDTNTTPFLVKVVRNMVAKGEGVRGQRSFSPVTHGPELANFNFSTMNHFNGVFSAPLMVEVNAERNKATIHIPDFNAGNCIRTPQGATHCRLIGIASILSEYKYNPSSQMYEVTDPDNNSKNAVAYSEHIPLGTVVGSETKLSMEILPTPTLAATSALMVSFGIEFYQHLENVQYPSSSNNAMKILALY